MADPFFSPAAVLHAALTEAGYVVGSVSFAPDGNPILTGPDGTTVLPPTDPAYAFARTVDLRPTQPRPLSALYADVGLLSAESLAAATRLAVARSLASDPGAFKTITGVDIPTRELEPPPA